MVSVQRPGKSKLHVEIFREAKFRRPLLGHLRPVYFVTIYLCKFRDEQRLFRLVLSIVTSITRSDLYKWPRLTHRLVFHKQRIQICIRIFPQYSFPKSCNFRIFYPKDRVEHRMFPGNIFERFYLIHNLYVLYFRFKNYLIKTKKKWFLILKIFKIETFGPLLEYTEMDKWHHLSHKLEILLSYIRDRHISNQSQLIDILSACSRDSQLSHHRTSQVVTSVFLGSNGS